MASLTSQPIAVPRAGASTVAALVAFALSRGMTLAEIERLSGITASEVVDHHARIPESAVARLWLALEEREAHTCLPVEMARAAPLSFFSGLAHGMQFAGSLRDALMLLVRNQAVLSDRVVMKLIEASDEAAIDTFHPDDPTTEGRLNMVGMVLTIRLIRERLEAGDSLKRVELAFPARYDGDAFQAFIGLPVTFNRDRTRLIFYRERLERPLRQGNLELFAYVDRHFQQLRERTLARGYSRLVTRLKTAAVDAVASGDYSTLGVASRARMTLRSAQRIAGEQGLTLRQLIDEVRQDIAKKFLSTTVHDLATIASFVGYSDDRAFRRAFKRWTGRSPSAYRSAQRDA